MSERMGLGGIASDLAPQLLTVGDAAAALAMSKDRVRQLLASGEICGKRDGRIIKIAADEVARYAASLPSYEPGVGA